MYDAHALLELHIINHSFHQKDKIVFRPVLQINQTSASDKNTRKMNNNFMRSIKVNSLEITLM